MAFHRFTVPNYTGGLPGGYDYINNAGVGTPAPVAGPRADGGPNNGTYFLGFGEDGRSIFVNRGLAALAQNTDHLDDLLRKDLAIPAVFEFVAAGAQTSVLLTGPGIFLGNGGYPNTSAGINRLYRLTDAEDVDVFQVGTTPILVSSITGGAIAAGYSTGNITLNLSAPLTNGVTYRVYYLKRSNLATLLGDEFLEPRLNSVRSLQQRITTALGNLASQVIPGTSLIGGNVINDSFGGNDSNLAAGTLRNQLEELLEHANRQLRTEYVSSDTTLSISSGNILCSSTNGAPFSVTLPDPGTAWKQRRHFWVIDDHFGDPEYYNPEVQVTLLPNGAELINGQSSFVLKGRWGHWILETDGTDWFVSRSYSRGLEEDQKNRETLAAVSTINGRATLSGTGAHFAFWDEGRGIWYFLGYGNDILYEARPWTPNTTPTTKSVAGQTSAQWFRHGDSDPDGNTLLTWDGATAFFEEINWFGVVTKRAATGVTRTTNMQVHYDRVRARWVAFGWASNIVETFWSTNRTSWTAAGAPGQVATTQANPLTQMNDATGVIVGMTAVAAGVSVFRTADGGATLTIVQTLAPSSGNVATVSRPVYNPELGLWMITVGTSTFNTDVWTSADDGATWTLVRTIVGVVIGGVGQISTNILGACGRGFFAWTGSTGTVLTTDQCIYSLDGGISWRLHKTFGNGNSAGISSPTFATANNSRMLWHEGTGPSVVYLGAYGGFNPDSVEY